MELYTNPKHWEVLLNNKVFTSCDTLQSKEDCIRHIAVVTVGWTVVAASVVGVGNTVHWIEKQGRCKESLVKISINELYAKTVDVGGYILETGKDFVDLLYQYEKTSVFLDKAIVSP